MEATKRTSSPALPMAAKLTATTTSSNVHDTSCIWTAHLRMLTRACPQTRQFSTSPPGQGGSNSGDEVIRNFGWENSLISKFGRHPFCVSAASLAPAPLSGFAQGVLLFLFPHPGEHPQIVR